MATKTNPTRSHSKGTASGNEKSSSQTAAGFDFSGFPQSFAQQNGFFGLGTLPAFQPANLSQWMEQIVETGQRNIETLTACAQLYAERAKEIFEEQANLGSEIFQETTANWQETFSGANSDPRNKLEDLSDFAQYYLDKSAKQARKAAEDNLQICQQIGTRLSQRLADSVEELRNVA